MRDISLIEGLEVVAEHAQRNLDGVDGVADFVAHRGEHVAEVVGGLDRCGDGLEPHFLGNVAEEDPGDPRRAVDRVAKQALAEPERLRCADRRRSL